MNIFVQFPNFSADLVMSIIGATLYYLVIEKPFIVISDRVSRNFGKTSVKKDQ